MNKIFMYIAFIFMLSMGCAVQVSALPATPGRQHQGIDVSQWQGDIDFEQVAASGIRVVYIRSSLGGGFYPCSGEDQRKKGGGL